MLLGLPNVVQVSRDSPPLSCFCWEGGVWAWLANSPSSSAPFAQPWGRRRVRTHRGERKETRTRAPGFQNAGFIDTWARWALPSRDSGV